MNSLNSGTGANSGTLGLVYDPNEDRILVLAYGLYHSSAWKGWTLQTIEATSSAINGASNTPVLLDSELTSSGTSSHGLTETSIGATYSPDDNKIMIAYIKRGASDDDNRAYAVMATLSSTSVSLGTRVAVDSDPGMKVHTGYDELVNKFIIYRSSGTGTSTKNADYYTPTVSGTSITIGSAIVVSGTTGPQSNNHYFQNMPYVSSNYATYNLVKGPDFYVHSLQSRSVTNNLNTDGSNLLGIAAESISDTATGKLTIVGGINENQSSLTIGTNYFTNNSGVVGTSGVAFLGRAIAADKIQIESAKEELDVGTSANNLLQLDSNAKIPEVDGSQLTNLPAATALGSRIFCGSYDFRVDGSSAAENVLISLPSDYTAANVRSYEINVHGVGFASDGNHLCMLPYNGSSSVYTTSYNTHTYMNGNSGTATNGSKTQSTAFILNWANSTSYDSYSANTTTQEKQTYNNASGHGGQLVCRAVYTNSRRNGSLMYDAAWRYGSGNNNHSKVLSMASASSGASTSDYADGFYFYVGNDSQGVVSTAIIEGVISIYAIIG